MPRAAFAGVTKQLRDALRADGIEVSLVTSNRINTPEVAESVLADGCADLVSLARPFLADPEFVNKAAGVRTHVIGGAHEAAELDAKRAIDQGTRLAATL